MLGWPEDGTARLTLLGRGTPVGRGEVDRVTLPDDPTPLRFRRTTDALEVDLPPARRNAIGVALVMEGRGLTDGSLVEVG